MGLDRSAPRLRVRLLGYVEVSINGGDVCRFPTRKSELLLGFLALHRDRFCLRDSLAAALWGDCSNETARKCLRTELWRVRSLLEPDSRSNGRHLTVQRDGVRLATSPDLWLDVEEFEKAILPLAEQPGQAVETDGSGLRQAVSLYRGDFLSGHDEDWCLFTRERYRGLFLSSLQRLMDHDPLVDDQRQDDHREGGPRSWAANLVALASASASISVSLSSHAARSGWSRVG